MLIIRRIQLKFEFYKNIVLSESDSIEEKREIFNDCLSKICSNLLAQLTPTRVNRLRIKKFYNLPQNPAGTLMSFIINYILPFSFPPSLDIKGAWILYFLKMVLRLLAFQIKYFSFPQGLVIELTDCHVVSDTSLDWLHYL